MNSIELLLEKPFFQTLGWTLLHFIWQGALVAILLANLNILLRKRSANLRYVLSCAAMLLMLALPVATFIMADQSPPEGFESVAESADANRGAQRSPAAAPVEATLASTPLQRSSSVSLLPAVLEREKLARRLSVVLPWMVAVWLAGVLLLSLRVVAGWGWAQRLKRRQTNPVGDEWQEVLRNLCVRLRVSKPVRLCQSLLVEVPTVIGWLRPVILVPIRALTGLAPQQLEALLAHELAHIRRHDYLVNLLQTIVETLLFYHPAVWWVSHQVRVERENCCDDMAVAACGDVMVYARALAELEQLRTGSGDAPALAVAATGGSLMQRVGRLVKLPPPRSHRSSSWLAGLITIATILCVWAGAGGAGTNASPKTVAISAPSVFGLTTTTTTRESSPEIESISSTNEPLSEARAKVTEKAAPETHQDAERESDAETASHMAVALDEDRPALEEQNKSKEEAEEKAEEKSKEKLGEESDGCGDYIDELAAEGYTKLSVDEIVALRIHGVGRNFIRQMKALGFGNLSVDKLLAMRIHGVSAATVEMMKSAGFDNLSPDQLVAVRVHNITPAFVQEMKAHLQRGNLSLDQLMALRVHGITGDYIESLKAAGFENLSAEKVVAARIHGVTPSFIKAMKDVGYANLSMDKLVTLRIFGVTPEFVRVVRSRGFDDLSVEQLVQLKRLGIIKTSTSKP